MNYKAEVRKFVLSDLLFGADGDLKDSTSFLESGVVDSTGILEVIFFLEKTYHIKIEPEETVPENLDSLDRISEFLARKLGTPATDS